MDPIVTFSRALRARPRESWPAGLLWTTDLFRVWILSEEEEAISAASRYLLPNASSSALEYDIVFVVDKEHFGYCERLSCSELVYAKPDVRYRKTTLLDHTIFVSDSPQEPNHAVILVGRSIIIVSDVASQVQFRVPVRIVRELLLRLGQNDGGLFCHAAAVGANRGAVLIFGDKAAGKTTTMWALCRNGPFNYIANDRCVIFGRSEAVDVASWPLSVRVGAGLANSPKSGFEIQNFHRRENAKMKSLNVVGVAPKWGETTKFEITPQELEGMVPVTEHFVSSVKAVLLPQLSRSGDLEVSAVERSDAKRALLNGITEPIDEDYLQGWLGLRTIGDEMVRRNIEATVERLLTLPCYAVTGDADTLLERTGGLSTLLRGAFE